MLFFQGTVKPPLICSDTFSTKKLMQMVTQTGTSRIGRNASKTKCLELKTWNATCLTNPFSEGGGKEMKRGSKQISSNSPHIKIEGEKHFGLREAAAALLTEPSVRRAKPSYRRRREKVQALTRLLSARKTGVSPQIYPLEIKGFVSTLNQWEVGAADAKRAEKRTRERKCRDSSKNDEIE